MATAMYSGGRIRTNLSALNAYNALSAAGKKISEAQLRISTGKKINNASDDVAGFITSRSLASRNGALTAAKTHAGDAKNVTTIAMDSLTQIGDLLTQIKDMAAQASAGALGTDEKTTLASSAFKLAQQIQFITDSTVFGGKQLLNGGYSGEWVTGYSAVNSLMTIGIDLAFNVTSYTNGTTTAIGAAEKNQKFYNIGDGTTSLSSGFTSFNLNATQDQLGADDLSATNPMHEVGNTGTAAGYNGGLDTKNFAGVVGLNLKDLGDITADTLATSLWGLAATGTNIQLTMKSLDMAINNVNKVTSYLGGIQTRLNSQEETLTSQITNYKAAISRIEDADVAEEQMKLIINQFLQSASLTSLAQANNNPSDFLQLLK